LLDRHRAFRSFEVRDPRGCRIGGVLAGILLGLPNRALRHILQPLLPVSSLLRRKRTVVSVSGRLYRVVLSWSRNLLGGPVLEWIEVAELSGI
jgi:hypothetical protein